MERAAAHCHLVVVGGHADAAAPAGDASDQSEDFGCSVDLWGKHPLRDLVPGGAKSKPPGVSIWVRPRRINLAPGGLRFGTCQILGHRSYIWHRYRTYRNFPRTGSQPSGDLGPMSGSS